MASDSDDADFFDKLVDDDDDDDRRTHHALTLDTAAAAVAADFSTLTLPKDDHTGPPEPEPRVEAPSARPNAETEAEPAFAPHREEAETAAPPPNAEADAQPTVPEPEGAVALPEMQVKAPTAIPRSEGGSPGSAKSVHTAVKQVQWSAFATNSSSGGADPFGDLMMGAASGGGGGDDAFFGGNLMMGDQCVQASVVAITSSIGSIDHSSFNQVDNVTNSHSGWTANAMEFVDHTTTMQSESTGGDVDSASTDTKYLESLYPGWKYDEATQQWYQVDTYNAQGNADICDAIPVVGSDNVQQQQQFSGSYFHNSSHVGLETITEEGSTVAASWGLNESSAGALEYPSNMVFYAEYPGWYFDTNTQQWHSLESYQQGAVQTAATATSPGGFSVTGHNVTQTDDSYAGSQSYKGFEPYSGHQSGYKGYEQSIGYQIGHKEFGPSTTNQASHVAYEPLPSHYNSLNGVAKPQEFIPTTSMYQSQTHAVSDASMHMPESYLSTGNSLNFAPQQFIGSSASHQQFGYSPLEQRSSNGRPPHTSITFGFGGKLVVVRETSSMSTNFGSGNQGNPCGTVSILNVSEIIADKIDHPSIPNGSALSYFRALCREPIPGPLVGGSAAAKDVNKWLDDITGRYDSSIREFQGGDDQKLLISLLKILCQHYGKLRSPFGSDPSQEGIDGPEMAVTKLFSSCKGSGAHKGEYGAIVHCMKNLPSENQIQATAKEVQNLLVSGRRKEALQYAQQGQLWGPALILALQLGDKFYVDTVKKMAYYHFISGSPLRTLCLLIAGQPADVFNVVNPVDTNYGNLNSPQQSVEATNTKGMLDDWQENLAIITANRTKGDDLVIIHLGDCLWKDKNEVTAAHSCYLAAELNVESYSETARMCLIGADHLRCPRTFTSPEAIQGLGIPNCVANSYELPLLERTEVYEYAKILGNSQYILLPFQPYKLVYAYMLADVGKISDSLRYCQSCLKLLRASGHAPELEAWKQLFSSLEERIRTHQQGGYGTNLAPTKLVGKFFTSIDKSLSRMMGTQPSSSSPLPPLPPLPQGSSIDRDFYPAPAATKVVNSQPAMAMSSLISSASEQSMSEMAGNSGPGLKVTHNRSVSEPDFGRNPKQGAGLDSAQSTSGSGSSRFGWLLQKTMGLVSKSHHQAKLGEQNKFYYDEKLKRWVEEGNGGHAANGFAQVKPLNLPEPSLGMPQMPPPSQNQFSARGRMGVRSRYVDTFNKGGSNAFGASATLSYSKPATPSMAPLSGAAFFVPTPAVASDHIPDSAVNAHQDEPSSSAR
ncbi:hypothetical protein GUJ93_ZPchr0012g21251 [Zizania palustris]|uniref:Protein transport protein sec16 n=1 Tax=Zizania palustris TaxID=103762 RepID=A0A8J5WT11_ZIZPA|nr:hypothetical protein GUJ93_ZPchr0012g21251 [Zizania palustris]